MIWRTIFRLSLVAAFLAAVPYIMTAYLRQTVRGYIILPPILAFLLALFVLLVLENEVRLFARITHAHHTLQNRFYNAVLSLDDRQKAQFTFPKFVLFEWFVRFYGALLILLTAINLLIIFVKLDDLMVASGCPG